MEKIKYRYLTSEEAYKEFHTMEDGKYVCHITDAMERFDIGAKGLDFSIIEINQFSPEKLVLFEGDFPDRMFYRLDDAMHYEDFPDPVFSNYPMCHAKNKVLSATVGFMDQPMTDEDLKKILKEFEDLTWLNKYDPAVPRVPRRLTKAEEKKFCEDFHVNDIVKDFYGQKSESSKS